MDTNNAAQPARGWLESIKESLNLESCIKKMDLNTCRIIEIASYFAAGFFVGFLLKRFGKIFFLSLIILGLALFILSNFKMISIDWFKIRELTGISPTDTIGGLAQTFLRLIKNNLPVFIGALIGFLIGCRVG